MSFHQNDPVISVQSPEKGEYPMTVRTVCVTPGQMLQKGERIAELLEPSGRWVNLVATQAAGQIKAVRVRPGDALAAPAELAAIYVARRPRPEEDPLTGTVTRMSLEDLQAEEFEEPVPLHRTPLRPIALRRRPASPEPPASADRKGWLAEIAHHKRLIAGCLGAFVVSASLLFGTGSHQRAFEQPNLSMDQLWLEMRAARTAAAEAQNAKPGDDLSTRAAAQNRALVAARAAPIQSGACAGLFVGMQLPGLHITQGRRSVTYLDPRQGVGAFVWSRSLEADTFSCAQITQR